MVKYDKRTLLSLLSVDKTSQWQKLVLYKLDVINFIYYKSDFNLRFAAITSGTRQMTFVIIQIRISYFYRNGP